MNLDLNLQKENFDAIRGVTIEERARLVLHTLRKNIPDITLAYRKLASKYHPDKNSKNPEYMKLINEAYGILKNKKYPKNLGLSLLANDNLIIKFTGRKIGVLNFIKQQKESEKYNNWVKNQFYGSDAGVI